MNERNLLNGISKWKCIQFKWISIKTTKIDLKSTNQHLIEYILAFRKNGVNSLYRMDHKHVQIIYTRTHYFPDTCILMLYLSCANKRSFNLLVIQLISIKKNTFERVGDLYSFCCRIKYPKWKQWRTKCRFGLNNATMFSILWL